MDQINHYPFDSRVPRRVLVAEAGSVSQVRERLEQLAEQAARKRETFHSDAIGSPRESINFGHYGAVMAERRRREATEGES